MFFLIRHSLKINIFPAHLLFRRIFFSRISNYSEYVLLPNSYFFRKRTFLGVGISWKKSLFLIVLRNQFHSIYTWKEFTLTNIHSFEYSMVSSLFEIPQFLIDENSKQRINFIRVTHMSFWEPVSTFGIFKQASKNSP